MNVQMPAVTLVATCLVAACASHTSPAPPAAAGERTTVAETSTPASRSAVESKKQRLLATALVSNGGSACWDAARHAPIVADTTDDEGTPYIAPMQQKIDLDGDGTLDPVIEVDREGPYVRYELYVQRGPCARHVGTARVEGTIRGPLGRANGLRTLEFATDEPREQRFGEVAFDGRYWVVKQRWTVPVK